MDLEDRLAAVLMETNAVLNKGHVKFYSGLPPISADAPSTGNLLGYHKLGFNPVKKGRDGRGLIGDFCHTGETYVGPWYVRVYSKDGTPMFQIEGEPAGILRCEECVSINLGFVVERA